MTSPATPSVWFEIPAQDFARATRFYETVLGLSLRRERMDGCELGVFPYERPASSGCIIGGSALRPSDAGTIVYLNAEGVFDEALGRIEAAGGAVLMPVTDLPNGLGRITHIRDTEGNRVGLHAMT